MIEQLANSIAVNVADNIKDYTQMSKIFSKRRHKEYKLLNKDEIVGIIQYGLEGFLSETVKTGIILVVGGILGILTPAIFIMLAFCTLRMLSGGVHMDTYIKCLSIGSILFLLPAWIIQNYNMYLTNNLITFIGIITIISLICAGIYAPVDCQNKVIYENDKMKYKIKTLFYILILFVISLFINSKIISTSIEIGMVLQIFTVTPIGIKVFNNIENMLNKIAEAMR